MAICWSFNSLWFDGAIWRHRTGSFVGFNVLSKRHNIIRWRISLNINIWLVAGDIFIVFIWPHCAWYVTNYTIIHIDEHPLFSFQLQLQYPFKFHIRLICFRPIHNVSLNWWHVPLASIWYLMSVRELTIPFCIPFCIQNVVPSVVCEHLCYWSKTA